MGHMTTETKVAIWLDSKFREWRAQQLSRRAGITQFAEYLGVSRNTLNNWMLKGQTPAGENVQRIAEKFGLEIYDLLGLQRPDPKLQAVIRNWSEAPDTDKELADFILLRSKGKDVSREKKAELLKNLKALIVEAEQADQAPATDKKKNRKK